MWRRIGLWFPLVVMLAATAPASAFELSPSDAEKLEQAESPYKVSPEQEGRLRALLSPFDLDASLPGGFVLDGIQINRHTVRLVLLKGPETVSVYLIPPVVEVDGAMASPSFKLLVEGEGADEATAAVLAAVIKNDDGNFWPEPEALKETAGRRVPVVARKLHVTELIGDFFCLLLLVVLGWGVPRLAGLYKGRSIGWWWALVGVVAYAFAARMVATWLVHGDDQSVLWSPSSELAHSSIAWLLNTLGRFVPVGTGLVAMLNVVFSTVTVLVLFLALSLLTPGVLAPLVGALVVASAPMHVALAGTITVMIPFVLFLATAILCAIGYARSRQGALHWLGAVTFMFAVFARPEGVVLALPILAIAPILAGKDQWRKVHFWAPLGAQFLVVILRLATLGNGPDTMDPFLSWQVDWATIHSNIGIWLVGFGRVSFAAMLFWAMGVAARPWKRELGISLVMLAWLVLGVAVYYHVDLTQNFQGGRVALYFLVPMAWLAAQGALFLAGLKHTQRWWLMVLLIAWLLATPLIHRTAIDREYKATYRQNFLIEA